MGVFKISKECKMRSSRNLFSASISKPHNSPKNMQKSSFTIFALAAFIVIGSAQAAVTITDTADFTLSSTSSPGTSHDNLPASFYELVVPGSITPTSDNTGGGSSIARLTDDSWATGHAHGGNSWYSNPGPTSVTLSFDSANLAGLAFNWAWDDRDEGDYEVFINGTISLGTFNVASGSIASGDSTEPNTYVVFDSVQTGVTSIQVNMSGGNNKFGLDELEVWAIPEPRSTALLAGLTGLVCVMVRRR